MLAPYKIIDCAVDVTSKLPALKAAGITGIIRYDYRANGWKQLTLNEANAILNMNFDLHVVYEGPGDKVDTFSNATGILDAKYALKRMIERNQPSGSAESFAVDFDATSTQIKSNIIPYFQGVNSIFRNTGFRVMAYCSGLVAETLESLHLINLSWITCSRGFAGTKEYLAANHQDLWQIQCEKNLAGLDIDYNVATRDDWGQWNASGIPVIQPKPVPVNTPPAIIYDEKWLQNELNKNGADPQLSVDGNVGKKTIQAMINYFMKQEHV